MQLHIFCSGKVQGVFFRDQTKAKALELNLKGFVKNLDDGEVEIVANGDSSALTDFMIFLKKDVKNAVVDGIEIKEEKEEKFETFSIKY